MELGDTKTTKKKLIRVEQFVFFIAEGTIPLGGVDEKSGS